MRHAAVKLEGQEIPAKLVDLPCVVETLKTFDKKNFYKVTDVSQMLLCGPEAVDSVDPTAEISPKKAERKWQSSHGVTAPLKNVRRRRFRKTRKKKFMDAPEVDKELKRLLRADLEATSVRWEVMTLDEAGGKQQIQQQGELVGAQLRPGPSAVAEETPLSHLREDDIFGGKLSSSESGSEDEGEVMAREMMGDVRIRRGSSTPAHIQVDSVGDDSRQKLLDELQSRLTDCQSSLLRVELQKRGQEAQIKAVDNPVLQQRMTVELDGLIAEENRLTTDIADLTEQIAVLSGDLPQ